MDENETKKVQTASAEEMAAFLAKRRPPDNVTVEVVYGDGDERRVTELHFIRSHAAFTRYAQAAFGAEPDPFGAAFQFLIDCAVEPERHLVTAFVEAYPVNAIDAAMQIRALFGCDDLETRVKNP